MYENATVNPDLILLLKDVFPIPTPLISKRVENELFKA